MDNEYQARIWQSLVDLEGGNNKDLIGFCSECGSYLRPDTPGHVCHICLGEEPAIYNSFERNK